jgi:hypothetical protein
MTHLKRFFGLAACVLLPASLTFAGGSIYSQYGIGDLTYFMGSKSEGMGSTGLAILEDGYINRLNPAALGLISETRFEVDFRYQGFSMTDGVNKNFLSSGNFGGAMIAFPVYKPRNIVFSLGVMPLSSIDYELQKNEVQDDIDVLQGFTGSGGITATEFSLSYSPLDDLNFGATLNYFFGTLHQITSLEFPETGYFANKTDAQTSADGFACTLGGLYVGIDHLLGLSKKKNLNLAFTYFSGGTLTALQQTKQDFVTVLDSVVASSHGSIKIPFGASAGLAYSLEPRTLLTCDVAAQQWGSFEDFGAHPVEIRNSMRVGIGAEFRGSHEASDPFNSQITYRVGGFVNDSYLDVNNQPINEYFLTTGMGLPVSTYGGRTDLNLALEYGVRGTTSHSLQKDSIIQLTVSLSGSEMFWFVPPATD